MFTAYVIKNTKNKTYTGSTDNIKERLGMHNSINSDKTKFHKTTHGKGPWRVIFSKEFKTRAGALKFEKYLKSGIGREWLERARRGE